MKKLLLIILIVGCDEIAVIDIDTTAPIVVITFPINNSTLDSTTTVKTDITDNNDIAYVIFLIDGNVAYTDSITPYQYEWDVCVQATGSHTFMAKARDVIGNEGQSDLLTYTVDASYDCASVCGGDGVDVDSDSICDNVDDCIVQDGVSQECGCNTGIASGKCDCDGNTLDCVGLCGGNTVLDECGLCGGNGIIEGDCDCDGNVEDCAGECGGSNICGCTDATALNYDQAAIFNDDNCEYYPIINCTSTQTATINMDGAPEDWSSLIPAVTDPEGNSVCGTDRDIKYIYTAIDNNYAYIMVETYNKPIHPTATVEINFSFASGALHTNISNSVNAWKPYPDTYPINEEIVVRESVIEIRIPLIELENTTYFNPTFVNIWDDNSDCDPINIDCRQ